MYCPFGNTSRLIIEREEFYPPENIFEEIDDFIKENEEPDYVWLKGTGDPILYSGFKKLTQLIKKKYPNLKIGSWLNGSLLEREDVRSDFSICDLIVIHLDSINLKEFRKIARPHEDVKLDNIIKAISLFKKEFNGKFGISSIFIRNINTNEKNLQGLKKLLLEINPDLYIVQEFNNEKFKPLPEELKAEIEKKFRDLPFEILFRF